MTNELQEDSLPVTTTSNAGAGLIAPQLPIDKQNIFRRFKKMKKTDALEVTKPQSIK